MSTQNAIVTVIHGKLGEVLTSVFERGDGIFKETDSPFAFALSGGGSLSEQLRDGTDGPPKITPALIFDIAADSVSDVMKRLNTRGAADSSGGAASAPAGSAAQESQDRGILDPGSVPTRVISAVKGHLGIFEQKANAITDLITNRDPMEIRQVGAQLLERVKRDDDGGDGLQIKALVERLRKLIGTDMGAVLPLATMVQAMRPGVLANVLAVPTSIEDAVLSYFFRKDGYPTIDGVNVVAPVHLSDLGAIAQTVLSGAAGGKGLSATPQLATIFSKPTAEVYLRDITRVIVESAYDAIRGLKTRREDVIQKLAALPGHKKSAGDTVAKFGTWFGGFSSMAESAAMRAVELGTQGVATFQTNPLIAAAAGSFAGTSARKLAQDSFLTLLAADIN